jgi:hypothetical protein
MHEDYLNETQVAAALSTLTAPQRIVVCNALTFPRTEAVHLAHALAHAQRLPKVEAAYKLSLVERIQSVDLEAAREERESEPLLDSICYELACVVKLPTCEHWQELRA